MYNLEMTSGIVFDIRKFSIQDGPGIRTTVFLKGCPLACQWCHNPESQQDIPQLLYFQSRCVLCGACVDVCPHAAIPSGEAPKFPDLALCEACGACVEACVYDARQISGAYMAVEEIMEIVQRDVPFYEESGGGVTVSGGEPFRQPAFLRSLLKHCKALDIHTVVDTCGLAPWESIEDVLPYVDLFLYDLKLIDPQQHQKYTGNGNCSILQNLERLAAVDVNILVRFPVIPGVTDTPQNLQQMADYVLSLSESIPIEVLPYHSAAEGKHQRIQMPYNLSEIETPSESRIPEIEAYFESRGIPVIRGD